MFQNVTILVTVPFRESQVWSRLEGARVCQAKSQESTEPIDGLVLPLIWKYTMWLSVAAAKRLPKPFVET